MLPKSNLVILTPLCLAILLSACAHTPQYRSSCARESDKAWEELSIAKAKGFSGTVAYTKALSLLTAAKTMQTVENHDACYKDAKKAREYISQSYRGE